MSDAHEVNDMGREMKAFLLEWLLNHGREPMWKHVAWGKNNDKRWFIFETCIELGLIDELFDPFTRKYNHKLTDEGMEFITKEKINEQ